jgi:hypothetical protein
MDGRMIRLTRKPEPPLVSDPRLDRDPGTAGFVTR